MATLTYAQRLGATKEEKDGAVQAQNVKRAALSLDSTILNTENQVAEQTASLENALSRFPADWAGIVAAKRDLEMAQDNLESLVALKAELFPA